MPYNNTPITPSKEITGTTALPLARVKKIIAVDDDIGQVSNNAAFVITVATEMFLQHLVEQAYNIVKSERKPRRNLQYRDVANAVARVENLEFLTDVVPKSMTYKQAQQRQQRQQLEPGQAQLDVTTDETYKPILEKYAQVEREQEEKVNQIMEEQFGPRRKEPEPEPQATNGANADAGAGASNGHEDMDLDEEYSDDLGDVSGEGDGEEVPEEIRWKRGDDDEDEDDDDEDEDEDEKME
ncbi:hypothetical protein BAUCODRAFT_39142 [Baudoinia panamericana UAMH 10762]|uniref:Transcription factor CBF/NF-Y/archaeal histone domain-containing protein n=1 Tax=Baudoinia panamericana (strain UAMH 10762) TaxID=717646 RepID=M2M5S8_BAUPA|nr:uncharacterized protein BAUCODRAFT_39142 [Baudoinia panamericana UAMH 10762]EMC91986.1 hypothetical protein BAUCODRAFT_39142 [Baudoinia panamericana UAMH 10762]